MASLRKFPRSPYWFACFTMPDGRRVQRSTKEKTRKLAQAKADEWDSLSKGRLKAVHAHRVIADIYKSAHGEDLPGSTVRLYLEGWLNRRKGEVSPATLAAYKGAAKHLLDWLGPKADELLSELDKAKLIAFRNARAEKVAAPTANHAIKVLRVILEDARRDGYMHENPAKDVPLLKSKSESSRRPLTLDEIKAVLAVAGDEWRSLIIFGLYTGQRLADLSRLTWANVDTEAGEIHMTTRKTGRMVRVPLCAPLAAHIEGLPSSDDPRGPLHPKAFAAASKGGVPGLSREFGELLIDAGLLAATTEGHRGKGIGRGGRRAASEISFHSLRHSATSMMKNAGMSSAVVQDIIGHSSAEMSAHYTKIDTASKRKALDSLPDITKVG